MSMTSFLIKPTLKKKFNFDEIINVCFIANFLRDSLELSGEGRMKGGEIEKRKCKDMKLSENKDNKIFSIFQSRIEKEMPEAIVDVSYLILDFTKNLAVCEVYYRHKETMKKQKRIFEETF